MFDIPYVDWPDNVWQTPVWHPTPPSPASEPTPAPAEPPRDDDPYAGYGHQGRIEDPGYTPYSPVDPAAIERRLREEARRAAERYGYGGELFDPSDVAGVLRNYYNTGVSGREGGNLEAAIQNIVRHYDYRAGSERTGDRPDAQGGRADGGGGSAGSGGTAGWIPPPSSPAAPALQERNDTLWQLLMERARQSRGVDRNDPLIRAQADAYAAQEERARRNYLADLAERQGALANLRGEQRMAAERMGQRVGAFEAQLLAQELEARRAEIAHSLDRLSGLLTADQEQQLRRELAFLEDALQRARLDFERQRFAAGLESEEDRWLREQMLRERMYDYAVQMGEPGWYR